MRHASLFSGLGGFDLAASWLGWSNEFQVELDPYCQSVLARHFPDTPKYTNIKDFDGRQFRGRIDVLSGGFPCQPFSTVGRRRGKDDPRWLWPEMLRVVREVQPTYVVGENVPGFIPAGLDDVLADLEGIGYEAGALLLPALAVGAPHHRDRVWILAHAPGTERRPLVQGQGHEPGLQAPRPASPVEVQLWTTPQPEPVVCGVANGVSEVLAIKALGNAIVPQCAYYLFRGIERHSRTGEVR